jgi:predicted N-acetyltransferase YhbS
MKEGLIIDTATENDIPQLVTLVNNAYRGETSKKGWTTEAELLEGIRIDENSLRSLMHYKDATLLTCRDSDVIVGCVFLEMQQKALYLGMLTVQPDLQAKGIGKKLLHASEQYAKDRGCDAIVMTVISVRNELIQWYQRHGYKHTGETKPFPNDPKFGIPKQSLEFVVLKKSL